MSTTVRLRELGIGWLDCVFVPPGLPLVDKGEEKGGTTSILVRGTAGSGKTTLALSLAAAIAQHHGGVVLFLTTEFSPAEIHFKAEVLRIPNERVGAWQDRLRDGPLRAPGAVLVESLQVRDQEDTPNPTQTRSHAAIEQLYGLLHPESRAEEAPSASRGAHGRSPEPESAGGGLPPVRAVVLDALTFPGTTPDSPKAREQLLTLVQALEHEGLSTVLVEEAGSGDPSWLTFVVDIVFELAFHADPDTGELGRKLVCRKSRYSFFDPGPHERSAGKERLCVWPSSLRFAEALGDNRVEPLPLALPSAETNRWVRVPKGGLVLSAALAWRESPALNALRETPGSRVIRVKAGATTTIGIGRTRIQVSECDALWEVRSTGCQRPHRPSPPSSARHPRRRRLASR